ncbi:MAG: diacylglycerol kinase family protein [Clostridia bacterium]|nr:diacylglycerol kinase family protein [Clostridia bacterium]
MNDVKSLAKSFVYAYRGIRWAVCHERNFRIHITCMCYMFYYLLRYDFFTVSKAEMCILLLSSALVLGGELINTGIEKADDTVSRERRRTIEISKNAAAGAVLIFAVFSVIIGVVIMFQPEAFVALFNHYVTEPVYILFFALSVVVALLFIFKFGKLAKYIRGKKK